MRAAGIIRQMRQMGQIGLIGLMSLIGLMGVSLTACTPEPPLHLYDSVNGTIIIPGPKIELDVVWDYEIAYDIKYDWQAEWYYGWDDHDRSIWGEMGYTDPTKFYMRRYYSGEVPYGPHKSVIAPDAFYGNSYQGKFEWGYWDLLVYNEPQVDVLSIHFDESDPENIIAYTNPSMYRSRYQAPRFTNSFYSPEPLFSVYEQAVEINRDLRDFIYDEERNLYIRKLELVLLPITYVYLTQVILHNNRERVTGVDGVSNLSGMARTVCLQTQRAGSDAITVNYTCVMKKNVPYISYDKTPTEEEKEAAEKVDIIGGQLMTFGMCNLRANSLTRANEVKDKYRHYIDVNMQFNNGMDSTFVFDVTDQVRKRYKGGVLTVELDMDTVPIPSRTGGSGFDAVVKDFEDGGTHEFEM